MDLDGDGRTNILSGSWPGEIYFFRRLEDGSFAAPQILKDKDGKDINVGHASSVFAVDWNRDGKIDLLVGTVTGEVFFIPNEGVGKELRFGEAVPVQADGKAIEVNGDAAPVAVDWDGDGKFDLLVGAGDGSVVWHRNSVADGSPKLAKARMLIAPSRIAGRTDADLGPNDCGFAVKPCVADWDGDGKLSLLVGDYCGSFEGRPDQTAKEKAEEDDALLKFPDLTREWSTAFAAFRKLRDAPAYGTDPSERENALKTQRERLDRLRREIIVVQEIQSNYRPQSQAHGYVSLFRRTSIAAPRSGENR